jgi:hypothetical protein
MKIPATVTTAPGSKIDSKYKNDKEGLSCSIVKNFIAINLQYFLQIKFIPKTNYSQPFIFLVLSIPSFTHSLFISILHSNVRRKQDAWLVAEHQPKEKLILNFHITTFAH